MKATNGYARLLGLTLAASLVSATLLSPAATAAIPCCGTVTIVIYYSDPAKTKEVGRCRVDGCTGDDTCSNPLTPYVRTANICCTDCEP